MKVYVTEHALLRYLERVLGADRQCIYREISEDIGPSVELGGNGNYQLRDGKHVAVVENKRVITILNIDEFKRRKAEDKKRRRAQYREIKEEPHGT